MRLQAIVPPHRLEDLVITVHRAMTAPGRNYHRIEHAFSLVEMHQPLHTLAAFFHDIVYLQVDMEIPPEINAAITDYIDAIDNTNSEVTITATPPVDDRPFAMALAVFDFEAGRTLSVNTHLNEFLSALVMLKKLDGLVNDIDMLHLIVCIEATIPFRPATADGKTHFDLLKRRLDKINQIHQLALEQKDIEAIIQSAVLLANKDLQGFAASEVGEFLDNTWQLLPETNLDLRIREGYAISAYRSAMQKMEAFLRYLDGQPIFHQYLGIPDNNKLQELNELAQRNIRAGSDYLRIKLLAIAILEALAEVTGGDVPLALFMGNILQADKSLQRFEDFLPKVNDGDWVDFSSMLGQVLKLGRTGTSDFDVQDAPISLFLYRGVSPAKINEYVALAQRMFQGELPPSEFLNMADKFIVAGIASACAEMVATRREPLLAYT